MLQQHRQLPLSWRMTFFWEARAQPLALRRNCRLRHRRGPVLRLAEPDAAVGLKLWGHRLGIQRKLPCGERL